MNSELLSAVNLADLRQALLAFGWTPLSGRENSLISEKGEVVTIPDDAPDSAKRILVQAIFGSLSEQERSITPYELLSQYVNSTDLLLLGIGSSDTENGRLPLIRSRSFYDRWSRFLLQIAAAEDSYNAKGVKRPSQRVRSFIDSLTWGHTQSGSYLHTLHIPIESSFEPFGRKFWGRMLRSLHSLQDAITGGDPNLLMVEEAAMWNAPLCEGMGKLISETHASTVIAKVRPELSRKDILGSTKEDVTVDVSPGNTIDVLMEAASSFRGIQPDTFFDIQGFVYELSDPSQIGGAAQRTIRILWEQEDSASLKLQIMLNEQDYSQAIVAHSSRHPIALSGRVSRSGLRYVVQDYTGFRML